MVGVYVSSTDDCAVVAGRLLQPLQFICHIDVLNPSLDCCKDIDECLATPPRCDASTAKCVNTPGSYRCDCRWGYKHEGDDQGACTGKLSDVINGVQVN